jgi:hypothetical protein
LILEQEVLESGCDTIQAAISPTIAVAATPVAPIAVAPPELNRNPAAESVDSSGLIRGILVATPISLASWFALIQAVDRSPPGTRALKSQAFHCSIFEIWFQLMSRRAITLPPPSAR